jgi:hypothetical protein
VDVPAVTVDLDVTLNGAPVSAANTGDNDEGELILKDPDTGEVLFTQDVWDDANDVSFYPIGLQVIPGTYEVYYSVMNDGIHWPANQDTLLQCVLIP